VVELTANRPAVERARAVANTGDWELSFDRPQAAAKKYGEAYAMLERDGMPGDEIDAEFGSPRMLTGFSLAPRRGVPNGPGDQAMHYVVASFQVTRTGRTRQISIVETNPPDSTRLKIRARKALSLSRFRPRIKNGEPVDASGVQIRYVFPRTSG
jgi:hypothetical protein